jgi:hypothetical protein
VCFIVRKTTSELERAILTTPLFAGAENTNSWRARKRDLQHAFPLDVLMVPSSAFAFSTNGERLTCGGFSLSEIIHLGSFEFITDYFGSQSLSPRRSHSGTTFMGSTGSVSPSPWWAMVEDSTKEFHMASSGGGVSDLPSHRSLGVGAPHATITTPPMQEGALAIQSMTTVQPWALTSWPHTGHSFE